MGKTLALTKKGNIGKSPEYPIGRQKSAESAKKFAVGIRHPLKQRKGRFVGAKDIFKGDRGVPR